MKNLEIHCRSCRHSWTIRSGISIHEQQAVESRPCPRCGAYTLCCRHAASGPKRRKLSRGDIAQSTARPGEV